MSRQIINEVIMRAKEDEENEPIVSILMINTFGLIDIWSEKGEFAYSSAVKRIMQVAESELKRKSDQVIRGRLGQVIVVLPDTSEKKTSDIASKIASKLKVFAKENKDEIGEVHFELSAAVFPDQGQNADELIAQANVKLIHGKRILIIDDDRVILETFKARLENYAHLKCYQANDGEQAVKIAAAKKPDLIICDLNMPKISGYEVIGRLKGDSRTNKIPIVVLTAEDIENEEIKSFYPESIPVISKIDGYAKLLKLVDGLI